MTKTFYVTTPIYYPSGKLHLGSSYTTVACDVLARYKRLMGYDTYFLTGTDEHGMKIQRKAKEAGMSEKEYLDGMVDPIQKLWELLDISNDIFMRTTYDFHAEACQKAFEKLLAQDDIYLGKYAGWYSVSDEEFFTETQLQEVFYDEKGKVIGGIAPSGHKVEWVEEESYFFRMGKYSDWLLQYYNDHPNFIQPVIRKNEMIKNFIKAGLEDLALTRTSFTWGITVKSNPKHVMYVWFDALLNYITALGYNQKDDSNFKKYWPGINIVGKEIVRFHAIYWPIMLHALGIEPSIQIFGHGWLLMKEGKMSKSKGNVIYSEMLVERYGLDSLRYYLMRAMPFGSDGIFTPENFIDRVNYDLANDLGNLLNRTIAMINQYNGGYITKAEASTEFDENLETVVTETISRYYSEMDNFRFNVALENLWLLISRTNKYIDETTPWLLAKNEVNKDKLNNILYHLAENLRVLAVLLQPFIRSTSKKIFSQLGLEEAEFSIENLAFGYDFRNSVVKKGEPIFPRLNSEEEISYIKQKMTGEIEVWTPEETKLNLTKDEIKFDAFDKVEIKVAEVIDCCRIEGSDKLLKFRLDAGDDENRQILSGIAEFYPEPEKLIGKKLQIVANLKPRKMMKEYISQGMILSSESKNGKLWVLEVPAEVPNGSLIG